MDGIPFKPDVSVFKFPKTMLFSVDEVNIEIPAHDKKTSVDDDDPDDDEPPPSDDDDDTDDDSQKDDDDAVDTGGNKE